VSISYSDRELLTMEDAKVNLWYNNTISSIFSISNCS